MSEATTPHPVLRRLPIIMIVVAALLGAYFLRDYLSFDALRENRAQLLAFRDDYFLLCVLGFIAAYAVIVAFSLPGATIATLTGGFLFGSFPSVFPVLPGVFFNVAGATTGAILLFLAARWGLGDALAKRMESSDGVVKRIKDGIDDD